MIGEWRTSLRLVCSSVESSEQVLCVFLVNSFHILICVERGRS